MIIDPAIMTKSLIVKRQFNDLVREDAKMKNVLMDIVKDLVDEKINAAVEEERKKADAAVEEERKKADAAVEEERQKAAEERKKADAKQQETIVYSIRNIMSSFDVTLDRAMDTLKIPAAQRENYANLVMREESSFANPE